MNSLGGMRAWPWQVAPFKASKYFVTNGEFLEFVKEYAVIRCDTGVDVMCQWWILERITMGC